MSKRIKVIRSIFDNKPLLETDQAALIEFRDDSNQLEAVVSRVLDGLWCYSCKQDPDWIDTLIRLGYKSTPGRTIQELIS